MSRDLIFPAAIVMAIALLAGCMPEPEGRLEKNRAIARWEDQRLAPADSLQAMLGDRDAHVRLAAVRAAGDMHVVDIRIHHPLQCLLTIDLLDGQDVGVEEPHIAAHPVVVAVLPLHRVVEDRLAVGPVQVPEVPGSDPQASTWLRIRAL